MALIRYDIAIRGRAFPHIDYHLDDPNYVPAKDEFRRKNNEDEGAVSTLLEEEPYPFFHMDYRLDKPRKSEKAEDESKAE